MRIPTRIARCLIIFLNISTVLLAIDNLHFYRPPRFHGFPTACSWAGDQIYETRNWKTTLDVSYAAGSATNSWNICGNRVPLLDINGSGNMLALLTNVQALPSPSNFVHVLAQEINPSLQSGSFAQLSFHGKFSIDEGYIDIRQNFALGFFLHANLPIRNLTVRHVCYEDTSPCQGPLSMQTPAWKRFKNNFDAILGNYDIRPLGATFSHTDIGDLSILGGWEGFVEQKSDIAPAFGGNLQLGILFPTSQAESAHHVFALPTGYNGHWGIPIHGSILWGPTSWLRLAARAGAIFFFDTTRFMRVQTAPAQQGPIKLAYGSIKESLGTHWYLATDAQFYHVLQGFSLIVGYSYNRAQKSSLASRTRAGLVICNGCGDSSVCSTCPPLITSSSTTCCEPCLQQTITVNAFNDSVINGDIALKSWSMQVIHLLLDYDFSLHMVRKHWAPRLKFFCDIPFTGTHVFITDMIGGGVGIDVCW